MPKKGGRGKKLSVHNISKGFCISCGASKSSKFRLAPAKWEAFYQFSNEERHEKKKRICSKCYLKLSKACKASTISDEQVSLATKCTDLNTINQVRTIVKPSPIGGNGLFALRDFVKGEVVAQYGGRILSPEDFKGKDSSYFRFIGLSKENGVIDGKYKFGDALGRCVQSPFALWRSAKFTLDEGWACISGATASRCIELHSPIPLCKPS
eukprot:TRINITY_DN1253_c0_g1_i1.p1 TRINITY_DN1253_c0_g1~~TRINITY_DN1253_c0_g1_i1.p1  ORF type:complete len:210 (-),score=5.98 TRINITY_DN1253_c0_g1_i1:243-872(-)